MNDAHETERFRTIIADLCAFTGLTEDGVHAQIARATIADTAAAYSAMPDTFYQESNAYLFELANYEDDTFRAALAQRVATGMPGAHVLEYGCGIGTQAIRFAEAGLRVTACDINRHNTAFLRFRATRHEWGTRLNVVPIHASLAGGARYDIVSCQHVLEHLEQPRAYLRRFAAALRPGGLFLGVAPFDLVGPDFPEHRPEHRDLRLENLCTEAGLHVTQVVEFGCYGTHPY